MEVIITLAKAAELNKHLTRLIPEKGRSAFANVTIRRLPNEEVSRIRDIMTQFNRLISQSKYVDKIKLPYADFDLVIRVIEDEDNKL